MDLVHVPGANGVIQAVLFSVLVASLPLKIVSLLTNSTHTRTLLQLLVLQDNNLLRENNKPSKDSEKLVR